MHKFQNYKFLSLQKSSHINIKIYIILKINLDSFYVNTKWNFNFFHSQSVLVDYNSHLMIFSY